MFVKKLFRILLNPMVLKSLHLKYSDMPLSVVLNKKPRVKLNVSPSNEGLFGIKELRKIDGFAVITNQCILAANELLKEANSPNRTRKLVLIFDELSNTLGKVADLAAFVRIAHPYTNYYQAAENSIDIIRKFMLKLNQDEQLYKMLSDEITSKSWPMDDVELYVSKQFLFNFEQHGTNLSMDNRTKSQRFHEIVHKLSYVFLTEVVTHETEYSDDSLMLNVCQYSENRYTREMQYKSFFDYDKKRDMILLNLLKQRHFLALGNGFPTYFDFQFKNDILKSTGEVQVFMDLLSDKIQKFVDVDMNILHAFKNLEYPFTALEAWDVAFYKKRISNMLFHMDKEEYQSYLSLGACVEGLNNFIYKIFKVKLEYEPLKPGEAWIHSVYKLSVHSEEQLLGYIYLDLYGRDRKPKTSQISIIRSGKSLNGQLPIVVIMTNWPHKEGQLQLSHAMLEDLGMQLGYALHPILNNSRLQYITAIGCNISDVKDIPAKLAVRFATDARVLKHFAINYSTNENMPADLIEKLYLAKRIFSASKLQNQIFLAKLDQVYHSEDFRYKSLTDILVQVSGMYNTIPYVPNTALHLRCTGLVNRGGQMYTSLLSEALASCIWQKLFEKNPFSEEGGNLFRYQFLCKIGTKPCTEVFRDLLQEELTPEMLADALSNEIEMIYNHIVPRTEKAFNYINFND